MESKGVKFGIRVMCRTFYQVPSIKDLWKALATAFLKKDYATFAILTGESNFTHSQFGIF